MPEIKSVCVYCGSSLGNDPAYAVAAAALGTLIAREGLKLVYGGGKIGLMGVVSGAALAAGGEVHGVIPHALALKEIAASDITEVEVVADMHVRKKRMADLADAFITLPGGLGTLEEVAETLTWAQLGWHRKPIGMLDVAGYFDPLLRFLDAGVTAGFMKAQDRGMLQVSETPEGILGLLRSYRPPEVKAYLGPSDI